MKRTSLLQLRDWFVCQVKMHERRTPSAQPQQEWAKYWEPSQSNNPKSEGRRDTSEDDKV